MDEEDLTNKSLSEFWEYVKRRSLYLIKKEEEKKKAKVIK